MFLHCVVMETKVPDVTSRIASFCNSMQFLVEYLFLSVILEKKNVFLGLLSKTKAGCMVRNYVFYDYGMLTR